MLLMHKILTDPKAANAMAKAKMAAEKQAADQRKYQEFLKKEGKL